MNGTRIDVRTPDGVMDAYSFQPAGAGPWPVVIVYMDAFGIRPELDSMAARLASHGYFVVVPNLYYRHGAYERFDPARVFGGDAAEHARFKGMIASIDNTKVMRDTEGLIAALDANSAARTDTIGVLGYCMGGGFAISALGRFPDRVKAALCFHGGSLATDKPDSPHLLASQMKGRLYVGVAGIDPGFTKEQQERLETALRAGGVNYTLDTYEGAKHGFAVTGHPVYDRDASERHWMTVVELLRDTLG